MGQHVPHERLPLFAANGLCRQEYALSFTPITAPRTIRDAGMPPDMPSTTMICSILRPTIDITVNNSNRVAAKRLPHR